MSKSCYTPKLPCNHILKDGQPCRKPCARGNIKCVYHVGTTINLICDHVKRNGINKGTKCMNTCARGLTKCYQHVELKMKRCDHKSPDGIQCPKYSTKQKCSKHCKKYLDHVRKWYGITDLNMDHT